jgi:hypothetical protein
MRRLVFVLLLAVVLIALSMAAQGSAQAADNPYNMEIFLSHDNDQNVLHQNCPKVPADTAIVACTFVIDNQKRGGPDCYILLATDQIIARHGGELAQGANLLVVARRLGLGHAAPSTVSRTGGRPGTLACISGKGFGELHCRSRLIGTSSSRSSSIERSAGGSVTCTNS